MTDAPPVIPIIVGPTAVGKTKIAVRVAERLGAEIISSDSRQIFRQMRIGTATPEKSILDRVPHHLIGELNVGDEYSAGIFADMARERIDAIHRRGRHVVITGGSTLYLRALTEGLDDIPDIAPEIRERLTRRLHDEGADTLYRELLDVDPAFAETLDETKTQRIVRGLEVYHGSGNPLSEYFSIDTDINYDYYSVVLYRPRQILYSRINARVDQMIESGLLDEVESVLEYAQGNHVSIPPTIGYRELEPVIRGRRTMTEGVRLVKRNSRRYAKRQLTWFRSLDDAEWIDAQEVADDEIVDRIISRMFSNSA